MQCDAVCSVMWCAVSCGVQYDVVCRPQEIQVFISSVAASQKKRKETGKERKKKGRHRDLTSG